MTNTHLLNEKIAASGLKKAYLAERCGLTRAGFYNCCNNRSEFRTSHVVILCEELGIDDPEEKEAIFFAKNVA